MTMRSALLSQAEIHALLFSGYNDSDGFDMSAHEPEGGLTGHVYSLSSHENTCVELQRSSIGVTPKLYFPLDPMVINCADPVTNRFAEVGITFQIREAKCAEDVKQLLPSLRSAILVTLSQKTSEELLSRIGKEKLASDILSEVGRVFGVTPNPAQTEQVKAGRVEVNLQKFQDGNPVVEVLFSSLIVH
jgi:flagellar FliL protein